MTERILIPRFNATVAPKGLDIKIDEKSVVTITDHTTDKIIAMINYNSDPNTNLEMAERIIDAIEDYIVEQ